MLAQAQPAENRDRLSLYTGTAHAIGALDMAVRSSSVAHFWRERAAVVGIADCLALAGTPLTPAEFFRAATGLAEPLFVAELDRALVSAVVAACLPNLAARSFTATAIARVLTGSRLLVDDEWSAPRGLPLALRTALEDIFVAPRADVGTALQILTPLIETALEAVQARRSAGDDWHGWAIAARLPALLTRVGLAGTALPCLTGLTRAMRYATRSGDTLETALLQRLGEQARDGLTLLRRLEACARAWRQRLSGLTARSRAGQAAAMFLVWPACTRSHLATAMGITPAGAGVLLSTLISRDIVEKRTFGGTTFYVATESLGDFKLAARQGRHPALPSDAPLADAIAAFDAELVAFDLLGVPLDDQDPDGGLTGTTSF